MSATLRAYKPIACDDEFCAGDCNICRYRPGETEASEMRKKQWEILLDYLKMHDGITGLQCIEELGIMNYKGRIHDIRKRGYTIKTTYIAVPNRRGGYSNVAWYSLKMGAAA